MGKLCRGGVLVRRSGQYPGWSSSVNRCRVGVVGGGADIEDKCLSVYGALGWVVADPERVVTSGFIALDVRGSWCGGLGRV